MKNKPHAVYILCFEERYHHAKHYLGISYDPDSRLKDHMTGNGNKLVHAVAKAKIKITKHVIMWYPNYTEAKTAEFNMKKYQKNKRWCPCCAGAKEVKNGLS